MSMDNDVRERFRSASKIEPHHKPPGRPLARPAPQRAADHIEVLANKERRRFRLSRKWLSGVLVMVTIAVVAGFIIIANRPKPKPAPIANAASHYFPASITSSQITIPVYFPVDLPSGFQVNGFSVIQHNVLYYVVTSNAGQKFYITMQP